MISCVIPYSPSSSHDVTFNGSEQDLGALSQDGTYSDSEACRIFIDVTSGS